MWQVIEVQVKDPDGKLGSVGLPLRLGCVLSMSI